MIDGSKRFGVLWRAVAVGVVALCGACATIERAALPDPTPLGPEWRRAAEAQSIVPDHAPWDDFLSAFAAPDRAGVVRVDYAAVTAADRSALQSYLDALEVIDVAMLTRDQQLAYWINLYNAHTVAIVVDAYPVDSIRDITDGALSFGPWDRKVATINGAPLSLNDIEHRIIRPVFREPRIHYALNCAAVGCPNLRPTAWRAEGLEAGLGSAERAYVNDLRGVSIDDQGRLTASKIYVWFREDFGASEEDVVARLASVAEPALKARLEGRRRIDSYAYDWSLNQRLE